MPEGATLVLRSPEADPEGASADQGDGSVDIVMPGTTTVTGEEDPEAAGGETTTNATIGHIDAPWAKDASGRAWPAYFTTDGTTLKLHVDLTPTTDDSDNLISPSYPVVADPKVSFGKGVYLKYNKAESASMAKRGLLATYLTFLGLLCGKLKPNWLAVGCGLTTAHKANEINGLFQEASGNLRYKCVELLFNYTGMYVQGKTYMNGCR